MDTLLSDLDAFFSEHPDCITDLVGGMLDDPGSTCVVWLACEACEAKIVREA